MTYFSASWKSSCRIKRTTRVENTGLNSHYESQLSRRPVSIRRPSDSAESRRQFMDQRHLQDRSRSNDLGQSIKCSLYAREYVRLTNLSVSAQTIPSKQRVKFARLRWLLWWLEHIWSIIFSEAVVTDTIDLTLTLELLDARLRRRMEHVSDISETCLIVFGRNDECISLNQVFCTQ